MLQKKRAPVGGFSLATMQKNRENRRKKKRPWINLKDKSQRWSHEKKLRDIRARAALKKQQRKEGVLKEDGDKKTWETLAAIANDDDDDDAREDRECYGSLAASDPDAFLERLYNPSYCSKGNRELLLKKEGRAAQQDKILLPSAREDVPQIRVDGADNGDRSCAASRGAGRAAVKSVEEAGKECASEEREFDLSSQKQKTAIFAKPSPQEEKKRQTDRTKEGCCARGKRARKEDEKKPTDEEEDEEEKEEEEEKEKAAALASASHHSVEDEEPEGAATPVHSASGVLMREEEGVTDGGKRKSRRLAVYAPHSTAAYDQAKDMCSGGKKKRGGTDTTVLRRAHLEKCKSDGLKSASEKGGTAQGGRRVGDGASTGWMDDVSGKKNAFAAKDRPLFFSEGKSSDVTGKTSCGEIRSRKRKENPTERHASLSTGQNASNSDGPHVSGAGVPKGAVFYPFYNAMKEAARRKAAQEEERKRRQAEQEKAEKEKEISRRKRAKQRRQLIARTSKGQPVMKNVMNLLLDKIKKSI